MHVKKLLSLTAVQFGTGSRLDGQEACLHATNVIIAEYLPLVTEMPLRWEAVALMLCRKMLQRIAGAPTFV